MYQKSEWLKLTSTQNSMDGWIGMPPIIEPVMEGWTHTSACHVAR
jgi:hypothetical protein